MCPECNKPLYGSASRVRHGKYFPAYHCDHRGHYFRRTKKEFDQTIENFVKCLQISSNYIEALMDFVNEAVDKQQSAAYKEATTIEKRIIALNKQVRIAVDKIKLLNSSATIKYLVDDIIKLEAETSELEVERQQAKPQEPTNMEKTKNYVRYFLEHLEELLLYYSNPVQQAKYFGLIFNKAPTYVDIESGTPDITKITGLNEVFIAKSQYSETYGWL